MASEALEFLYRQRRAFGQEARVAFNGAKFELVRRPAELMRRRDGSFRAYTDLGCYPVFYLAADSCVLCPECAATEDSWGPVVHADVNWEDPDLYCEGCSERIESAYAEPDCDPSDSDA